MNNVLVISYPFPPLTRSGTYRPAKFVKYLPEYDWKPVVITVSPNLDDPIDNTLSKDIPKDLKIIRIPAPQPKPMDHFLNLVDRFRNRDSGIIRNNEDQSKQKNLSIIARLKNFIKKVLLAPLSFVQYPPIDREIFWSLRVIPVARKAIKENDIKIIFTTSPPFSPLITGLILKMITGVPWVADFRDPWTTEELRYRTTGWRSNVNRFVERKTLRGANSVIGVTPNWIDDLQHIAGETKKSNKYYLITNGYDEADFSSLTLADLTFNSEVKISHIGSMYQGSIEPLLNGLTQIDQSVITKLRVEIIGYMHPQDLDMLSSTSYPGKIIYQHQRITHEESLELMCNSHVLLLSLPFEYFPGKVFEYMRVGRPVLAIAQDGAVADLIKKSGIGYVVNQRDSENLVKILEQVALDYGAFVDTYYHPNWEYIHQFERRILTQKLSSIFYKESLNQLPVN